MAVNSEVAVIILKGESQELNQMSGSIHTHNCFKQC